MTALDLRRGVQDLDELAKAEYSSNLTALLQATGSEPDLAALQLGRLIGVLMKQPFATPRPLSEPSAATHAHRAWDLGAPEVFDRPEVRGTWQYRTLEAIGGDPEIQRAIGWAPPNVYSLAFNAHHERGFFQFLVISIRRYFCRDPKLRKEIEKQIKAQKASGIDVRNVSPETIVGSGGFALGAYLVQHVPVLGIVGAPVIAGLILILYNVGLDGFCHWAEAQEFAAEKER